MNQPISMNEAVVSALYEEALLLADEVRSAFDLNPVRDTGPAADRARLAMSVEGLRTTTRTMHVLAWLLNYRAFFAGEMSEFQLRRHSNLPVDRIAEPANLDLLDASIRDIIERTIRLHARVARLDHSWRERFDMHPAAIHRLQARLQERLRCAGGENVPA
ncbi:MAG: DUF1465 family protein [Pontixanthobacter sp.]